MIAINRKTFLKLLCVSAVGTPVLPLLGADHDQLCGDRVGWARLKTSSPYWMRHSGSDPVLMNFFKEETTLNIDPAWYAADVNDLVELCKYPFLFSQGIGMIGEPAPRNNIAEYLRRGGFLFVDACCHPKVTPDFDEFLRQQIEFFSRTLPEARVVSLPTTHEIYSCHFQIPGGKPPHSFMAGIYDARKARHGLYGIMVGERMVGVISLCGLQCGWDHVTNNAGTSPPGHEQACMRMLVNIYIWAMMQGG